MILKIEIKNKVSIRGCPGCGQRVAQIAIELMRFNHSCPVCGKFKLSDFKVVPNLPPEPPKPKHRKAA